MLSKVSSTLGLSSASMAASESEFSISSSSKSPSPGAASPASPAPPSPRSGAPLNGVAAEDAAGGAGVCASTEAPPRAGAPAATIGWPLEPVTGAGMALASGTGIGRFEVDDVAQEDLTLVKLVAPNDDGLERERALAEPGDHRLAAGLDALGDRDLALTREQLHRAHLAQIHAHWIVRALGRLLGLRLGRDLLLDLDQFAALALALFVGLLGLYHVHAHLAEHGQHILGLLGIDLLGGQYRVDLVMGDVAARLGGADELFDRRVR